MEDLRLSEPMKPRLSVGKIILGTVLALLTGALFPVLAMYQALLPMAVPGVATMVSVALAVSYGWGFAALLWIVGLAMALFGMGPALAAAAMLMCGAPSAVIILSIRKRQPFFAQLRSALAACLGGTVLAVVVAAAFYGSDMVGRLMEEFQKLYESILPQLWESYRDVLRAAGTMTTYEEFTAPFYSMLRLVKIYYETYLAADLLSGAIWTAALSTLWGNWLAARRGMATKESFAGLHEWRLPANLTWGILMTLAAAFVLKYTSVPGVGAAWAAVEKLSTTAFTLQALGANDRRLKSGGASVSRRVTSVVLLMVLGGVAVPMVLGWSVTTLLGVIGAVSAVFGRYGALRPWMDKHKNDMNGSGR